MLFWWMGVRLREWIWGDDGGWLEKGSGQKARCPSELVVQRRLWVRWRDRVRQWVL